MSTLSGRATQRLCCHSHARHLDHSGYLPLLMNTASADPFTARAPPRSCAVLLLDTGTCRQRTPIRQSPRLLEAQTCVPTLYPRVGSSRHAAMSGPQYHYGPVRLMQTAFRVAARGNFHFLSRPRPMRCVGCFLARRSVSALGFHGRGRSTRAGDQRTNVSSPLTNSLVQAGHLVVSLIDISSCGESASFRRRST